ncbi:hypothetical protein ACQP2E_16955 [Actinoplanes sp. CA-015351]|uniref:hypothetical protein n=1 Tax=Actinoplanes sp. CA-015351 TaxID=3239897 RepID=UPI003D967124
MPNIVGSSSTLRSASSRAWVRSSPSSHPSRSANNQAPPSSAYVAALLSPASANSPAISSGWWKYASGYPGRLAQRGHPVAAIGQVVERPEQQRRLIGGVRLAEAAGVAEDRVHAVDRPGVLDVQRHEFAAPVVVATDRIDRLHRLMVDQPY